MFGTSQSAIRAPFGHLSFGRVTMGPMRQVPTTAAAIEGYMAPNGCANVVDLSPVEGAGAYRNLIRPSARDPWLNLLFHNLSMGPRRPGSPRFRRSCGCRPSLIRPNSTLRWSAYLGMEERRTALGRAMGR